MLFNTREQRRICGAACTAWRVRAASRRRRRIMNWARRQQAPGGGSVISAAGYPAAMLIRFRRRRDRKARRGGGGIEASINGDGVQHSWRDVNRNKRTSLDKHGA